MPDVVINASGNKFVSLLFLLRNVMRETDTCSPQLNIPQQKNNNQ